MSFKIPCGGFRLDEESFSLDENGVLSVSGGGSGGGGQPDWNQNDITAPWSQIKRLPRLLPPHARSSFLRNIHTSILLTMTTRTLSPARWHVSKRSELMEER